MIRRAVGFRFRLDDQACIFKVRKARGVPCRQVRELAAKLDEIETLLAELIALFNLEQ